MVTFSSKIVYFFIYLSSSSVSYSLIIGSLLEYFLIIWNTGGLNFLVDWMFWYTLSKWTLIITVIWGRNVCIRLALRLGQVEKWTELMDLTNVEMEGLNVVF